MLLIDNKILGKMSDITRLEFQLPTYKTNYISRVCKFEHQVYDILEDNILFNLNRKLFNENY